MVDERRPEEALARLAAQLTEAWNAHDPQRVAALCAADYAGENVGQAAPHRGPEGMAASVATYMAAFPDLHFVIDETVIQGGPGCPGVAGACQPSQPTAEHPRQRPAHRCGPGLLADVLQGQAPPGSLHLGRDLGRGGAVA